MAALQTPSLVVPMSGWWRYNYLRCFTKLETRSKQIFNLLHFALNPTEAVSVLY